jgi:hypothetical protein
MAVLERPSGYSLWVSSLLPSDSAQWSLLDSGPDRAALERQAKGLVGLLAQRRLAVVEGNGPPPWKPKL